jgi:ion channel-forming bestrophin family protein
LYYEDLYDLVRPLQPPSLESDYTSTPFTAIENLSTSSLPIPNKSSASALDVSVMTVLGSSSSNPSYILEHEAEHENHLDSDYVIDGLGVEHQGPWMTVPQSVASSRIKYRPAVAGEGDNLPLEILRCLSEWCSVLEDRGTVPGTSLGSILGCISSLEDSLTTMEEILTVPLPFVYSAHIRHTVWLFLVFLPFQLVSMFAWHAITGVLIASFIYLGFLAAGEEIEQPFGYDEVSKRSSSSYAKLLC